MWLEVGRYRNEDRRYRVLYRIRLMKVKRSASSCFLMRMGKILLREKVEYTKKKEEIMTA